MHFSDLIDVGKVIMLLICLVAIVGQSCDRFMIFYMKPPKIWFPALQKRVDSAVARFNEIYATAEIEGQKHYQSPKLRHVLLCSRMRLHYHESRLPWVSPRAFAEEVEAQSEKDVAEIEAALAYQQSPEFLLEAAAHLKAARDDHPERVAAHIRQIEKDFQQSLKRLQEAKESALRKGYDWHDEVAQSIEEQLASVETTLQQLVAGTTISTISS